MLVHEIKWMQHSRWKWKLTNIRQRQYGNVQQVRPNLLSVCVKYHLAKPTVSLKCLPPSRWANFEKHKYSLASAVSLAGLKPVTTAKITSSTPSNRLLQLFLCFLKNNNFVYCLTLFVVSSCCFLKWQWEGPKSLKDWCRDRIKHPI